MTVLFKIENGETFNVNAAAGESILDTAKRVGVAIDAPCGGNGTCGKCRVKLVSGSLSGEKSKLIDDAAWNEGWRLACDHKPADNIEVFVPAAASAFQSRIRVTDFSGAREKAAFDSVRAVLAELGFTGDSGLASCTVELSPPSLDDALADRERFTAALAAALSINEDQIDLSLFALRRLPHIVRQANFAVSAIFRREESGTITVLDLVPGSQSNPLIAGLAIDIGTTTVSMLLVDLTTGNPLSAASGGNAQIRFGADVINRIIESTKQGGLERLRHAIIVECLEPLIRRLCVRAGIECDQIYRVALAGNTTMTHLFLGTPPEFLRLEPYVPAFFNTGWVSAAETGLVVNPAAELVIAPAIGSYVGGDITAGVLAADFYRKETFSLFIDLGTNG